MVVRQEADCRMDLPLENESGKYPYVVLRLIVTVMIEWAQL